MGIGLAATLTGLDAGICGRWVRRDETRGAGESSSAESGRATEAGGTADAGGATDAGVPVNGLGGSALEPAGAGAAAFSCGFGAAAGGGELSAGGAVGAGAGEGVEFRLRTDRKEPDAGVSSDASIVAGA